MIEVGDDSCSVTWWLLPVRLKTTRADRTLYTVGSVVFPLERDGLPAPRRHPIYYTGSYRIAGRAADYRVVG